MVWLQGYLILFIVFIVEWVCTSVWTNMYSHLAYILFENMLLVCMLTVRLSVFLSCIQSRNSTTETCRSLMVDM